MKKKLSLLLSLFLLSACLCTGAQADSGKATSLREFADALETHTALLEESFLIPCSRSVTDQLKQPSPVGKNRMLLSELCSMSGMCGSYYYTWTDDGVRLSDITYYAGWRILCAWRGGRTDLLSARERRALETAQALVSGLSGSDLEKERYIYDTLCGMITYDPESRTGGLEEKDSAVGALLNGRADCDGYADAMLLCCGLAGIPCRYMHGDSLKPVVETGSEGLHMWNLVCIGGTWLMTDVTWGDQSDLSYLYFNLGLHDAADAYIWSADTLFTDVAYDVDFSRCLTADQQPVTVRTTEDVYWAVRSAALSGARRIAFFCPDRPIWNTQPGDFEKMIRRGGAESWACHDCGRLYELTDISLPDVFTFCDSESDILSAIGRYAARNVRSFTLYFHPSLAGSLLTGEHDRLRQLFSRSRLADPGTAYRFSDVSGSVTLSDVSYIAEPTLCDSADDVVSLIRRELPSRPSSLTFALADGLSFSDIEDEIAQAVYSLGACAVGYGMISSRVELDGLEYYPDYCLASTESDVASYLRSARRDGRSIVRIYCSDSLYSALTANSASRFFSMLKDAGFSEYTVYTTEPYGLLEASGLR